MIPKAIRRNKGLLKRLFFADMDVDASTITNIGLVKKAYYFFVDRIHPNYDISFLAFALVMSKLELYPFNEKEVTGHVELLYDSERNADKAGIAMLDPSCTFILLLESYNSPGYWDFPKEKKEYLESYEECAEREALEETGRKVYFRHDDFVQVSLPNGRLIKLYLVYNWRLKSEFHPVTSREIQSSAWFRIKYLLETPVSELHQKHGIDVGSAERIKLFIGEIQAKAVTRRETRRKRKNKVEESKVVFINRKDFFL